MNLYHPVVPAVRNAVAGRTDLQTTYQELEAVFHASPDGIMVMDLRGTVTRVNRALLTLLGKQEAEVVGRSCHEVLSGCVCSPERCPLRHALADGTALQIEGAVPSAEGAPVPCVLSIQPIPGPDGRTRAVVATIQDISERKRYEEALLESQQAAIRANENKDQFLRNISHELRTPLNGIIGMSSLLAATRLTDQQRLYINTVTTSSDHLLALVNDLLDFTRIEAGRLPLQVVRFDVRGLVEELRLLFGWKAAERGLVFQAEVEDDVAKTIRADRIRLKQVLTNVVDNAVKFTESGMVQLSVGRSEAEDHLCFSVSDTGIGMDPNDVSYIFESFRQLDGSYSRRRGGLGLGLSIANKLIQLMGGWINVETHPEKGTTMSVNIPNGEDSHAQHDHAAETGLPRSPENGLAVLVVEDEPINTLYLEELLHTHGCRVTSTRTGEEALSAVKRSSFDIALIDIGLPTISGIETAKRIRLWEQELGSSGHMPIVALTAHAFDEDRDACLAAGMDDFLTKPVDESALFGTIERLARAPDKTSGRD